jgi:membrane-bound serine protease (ClpP class)
LSTLAILLLVAAAILIIVEAFIPDFGICGILGISALVASMTITVLYVPFGIFYVFGELVVFGLLIFFLFHYVFKRRFQNKIVLNDTVEFDEPDINAVEMLGKEGVATTSLKPTGLVDFNGTILEAVSEGAYIHEHSRVKVIDQVNNRLIVRLMKEINSN